jgi:hypothetical protein
MLTGSKVLGTPSAVANLQHSSPVAFSILPIILQASDCFWIIADCDRAVKLENRILDMWYSVEGGD